MTHPMTIELGGVQVLRDPAGGHYVQRRPPDAVRPGSRKPLNKPREPVGLRHTVRIDEGDHVHIVIRRGDAGVASARGSTVRFAYDAEAAWPCASRRLSNLCCVIRRAVVHDHDLVPVTRVRLGEQRGETFFEGWCAVVRWDHNAHEQRLIWSRRTSTRIHLCFASAASIKRSQACLRTGASTHSIRWEQGSARNAITQRADAGTFGAGSSVSSVRTVMPRTWSSAP